MAWTHPGQEGEVKLAASVTVASYSPLFPHSPISGDTIVAEGSSREVAWRAPALAPPALHPLEGGQGGGPRPPGPLPHPALHRYSLT